MSMRIKLVEIKQDVPAEISAVVDFVNKHLLLGLPLDEETIRSGRITLFWAMMGNEKVGVSGYITKTPFLAETAKTVMHPDHRGKGLGARLSQAIEDEVRTRGFKKIITTIYVTNLPMIFIKLKQGYFFEGFHRDHDRPGLHEYSLGKIFHDNP
jgi:GNAT superfamily N-acetyltransferase